MRTVLLALLTLFAASAAAEPMRFEYRNTGGNACCWLVQANGEITADTPKAFEDFLKSLEFPPDTVRLNSPGGSLIGAILLGERFRSHGMNTAVGTSDDREFYGPGTCASACAYAFLGGVERTLDERGKLGVHRFYVESALVGPSEKMFTGQDLDAAQRVTAALVLYTLKMGVDARLVVLASEAGPTQMRWLTLDEARKLRVVHQPWSYKPWRIVPYRGGARAISEANDGTRRVVAACSKRLGPYVALIDTSRNADARWFSQCRTLTIDGRSHPVFGTRVEPSRVVVFSPKEGGAVMRFHLPTHEPPLTTPDFFTFGDYPRACGSYRFNASRENFAPTVRLALRNCYQD